MQTQELGTVQSVTPVTIEGDTGQYSSVGRSAGSSLGRAIGYGVDPITAITGTAAGVVGGVVGAAVEKNVGRRAGQKLEIVMDDGRYVTIIQEAEPPFVPGDRVKILANGSESRVEYAELGPM